MKLKNGTRRFLTAFVLLASLFPKGVQGDGSSVSVNPFVFQGTSGEVVEILVPQEKIDLELTLTGPDGKPRLRVDRPNGVWGNERLLFPLDETGSWSVQVLNGKLIVPIDPGKIVIHKNPPGRTTADAEAFVHFHSIRVQKDSKALQALIPNLPVWLREEARLELALLFESRGENVEGLNYWKTIQPEGFQKEGALPLEAVYCWLGARFFENSQKISEAKHFFLEASKRFATIGDRVRWAKVIVEVGRMERRLGNLDEAERLYLQGLPLLVQGTRDRVLGDLNYANLLIERGRFGAARRVLGVAAGVVEKSRDPRLKMGILQALARVDGNLGFPEIAEARLVRDLLPLREKLPPDDQALVLADLAETKRQCKKLNEALNLSREAETVAQSPRLKSVAQKVRGAILFDLGQTDAAIDLGRKALENFPPADPYTISVQLEIAGQLIRAGNPAEGLEIARKYTSNPSLEISAIAAVLAGQCALRLGDRPSVEANFRIAAAAYESLSGEVGTVAEKRALGRKFFVLPGLGAAAVPDNPGEAVRRLERFRCRTSFPVGRDVLPSLTSAARQEAESRRALLLAKGDPDSLAAAARIAGDLLLDQDDEAPAKIPAFPDNLWERLEPGEVVVYEVTLPEVFYLVCRRNGVSRSARMPKVLPGERKIFVPDPVKESGAEPSGWIEVSSLGLYLTLKDSRSDTEQGVLGISLTGKVGGLPVLPGTVRDLSGIQPDLVRMLGGPLDEEGLRSELTAVKPSVVHFGTHGAPDEVIAGKTAIIIEGRNGPLPITARVFRNLPASPRLVVLAACRTTFGPRFGAEGRDDLPAEIIRSGVPCVVAADGPLEDGYAGKFFQVFYRKLVTGKSVSESLKLALAACGPPPEGTRIRQFGADAVPFGGRHS